MLFGTVSKRYMGKMWNTLDVLGGLGGSLSMRKMAGTTTVDMIARTSICPRKL